VGIVRRRPPVRVETFGRKLLHDGCSLHARALLAEQRLVGQRAQYRQRCARDSAGGLEREATAKHRQSREDVALLFAEQRHDWSKTTPKLA